MFLSQIAKLFPPPNLLKVNWIGLDITDESIILVEIKEKTLSQRLGKYSERQIPAGIMDSGQIIDKAKLLGILKEVRKNSPTAYINASLPEEKSFLFTAEVGNGDEKTIRQNIEFILEENIPIPPAETLFEFDLIETRGKDQEKVFVSVTAMHSRIVEEYNDLFMNAGFISFSMEVEGRPLIRAIIPKEDDKHRIVVNYNERNAGIFLVSGRIVRYTSTIKLTAKDIPENFVIKGNPDSFAYLKREIEMVESYWYSKEPNKKINSIVVAGRKANDRVFLDNLKKMSKVPVEIANIWVNVCDTSKDVPEIGKEESLKYATAVGLAIKGR